jgi:uncharacterized membrane protein YphA (DoxX/SURF4 family)
VRAVLVAIGLTWGLCVLVLAAVVLAYVIASHWPRGIYMRVRS